MNDLGRKLDPGNVVILELLRLCYCLRLINVIFSHSSPFRVKEDDEVDNLEIKFSPRGKSKRIYQSPPPEVGQKISRSLKVSSIYKLSWYIMLSMRNCY